MTAEREVRALRGATTVARDSPDAIIDATAELLRELIARNALVLDDLISLVFTATPDLTAEFPAVAARGLGISDVALLSAQEIAVPGSLPRCIRVLAHCYSTRPRADLHHVYLGDARELRTDLLKGEG
ncbi:MAG: chorismate mutase [Actinomycetota bacterium]